eukprot:3532412-Pyramimonas_sp.AAC.1
MMVAFGGPENVSVPRELTLSTTSKPPTTLHGTQCRSSVTNVTCDQLKCQERLVVGSNEPKVGSRADQSRGAYSRHEQRVMCIG